MFNFWLILINCKEADIVIAEETNRPDGAPPTYDDAMKFVNDAFENNEVKIFINKDRSKEFLYFAY